MLIPIWWEMFHSPCMIWILILKPSESIHPKFSMYENWSYHDYELYWDQGFFFHFCNVIFIKGGRRKTIICSFKRIGGKIASIVDYGALFSKEIVKYLSFLFEICNAIIIMINWWNTRWCNYMKMNLINSKVKLFWFFNCDS